LKIFKENIIENMEIETYNRNTENKGEELDTKQEISNYNG
jgi:hypothetical protein